MSARKTRDTFISETFVVTGNVGATEYRGTYPGPEISVNRIPEFTDGELRELQDAMTFWLECRKQRVKDYKRWGNPTAAKMVGASVRRSKSILAKLGAGT